MTPYLHNTLWLLYRTWFDAAALRRAREAVILYALQEAALSSPSLYIYLENSHLDFFCRASLHFLLADMEEAGYVAKFSNPHHTPPKMFFCLPCDLAFFQQEVSHAAREPDVPERPEP